VAAADASPAGPIPVGAAIHTGVAWVGTVGPSGEIRDFTALGDPVNTTARLAALAAAGELLITVDTVERGQLEAAGRGPSGVDLAQLGRRSVDVRGRDASIDVYSLSIGGSSTGPAEPVP